MSDLPLKRGERLLWQGQPELPSSLLAYRGAKRAFAVVGIVISLGMALLFSGNWDEIEGGLYVFGLFLVYGPAGIGIALFLFFAFIERDAFRGRTYGVTSRGVALLSSFRYEIQPDDPIEPFRWRGRAAVRFNRGRTKRVWDSQYMGGRRLSRLVRMRPDAFYYLSDEDAREAEAALREARGTG
ncbi:MAG: hypothetical protein AAGI52_08255 [Bacteroidota bacterium]